MHGACGLFCVLTVWCMIDNLYSTNKISKIVNFKKFVENAQIVENGFLT